MELPVIQQLLSGLRNGRHQAIWRSAPLRWSLSPGQPICGVLSGSFNPLHEGHRGLLEMAAKHLAGPVAYELSIGNADKSPLDDQEVERRGLQFAGELLVVTCAPTFAEKSLLFPGLTFVVGADTAARVVDPRFYENDPQLLDERLRTIATNECRFLVAARRHGSRLLRLEDLQLPAAHRDLFFAIPPDEFRIDISSTDLRQGS